MNDVMDVAYFFLSKSSMTPKKLQKLIFYAYAWTLALLNENRNEINFRLFNDKIEAWVHGPVVFSIYEKYKTYGWNEIPKIDNFDQSKFSSDVLDILNQVWDVYGDLNGNQLESISHNEYPWINARKNLSPYETSDVIISDEDIFVYYNEQANK